MIMTSSTSPTLKAATLAAFPEFDTFLRSRLWAGRGTLIGRTAIEGRVVHTPTNQVLRSQSWEVFDLHVVP